MQLNLHPAICIRLLFALLLNVVSAGIAFAQTKYEFTRYTQEEGLVSGSITGIEKDKTGFIWLMSENGMMRFDGYEFKIFRHHSNDTSSIPASGFYEMKEDATGNILVRTTQALCKYVPSSSSFKKIISYSDSIRINDWILGSGSVFWATSNAYLLRIDAVTEAYTKFLMPASFDKTVIRLQTDRAKYLWLYNQKNQVICFDIPGSKFSAVTIQNYDSTSAVLKNPPRIICNDASGNTCLLIREGLYKYDAAEKIFRQISRSGFMKDPADNYQCDAIAAGNYLYAGMNNGSLVQVDMNNGSEKSFHLTATNQPGFIFNALFLSQDGSVWISTANAGAFHFFPAAGNWEQMVHNPGNQNSLLSNSTDFIYDDRSNVTWINSPGRGIVKLEPLKSILSSYSPSAYGKSFRESQNENVRTIISSGSENLLIGTLGGLLKFNTFTHEFSPFTSPSDNKPALTNVAISNIINGSDGSFWIAEWGSPFIYFVSYKNKIFSRIIPDSATAKLFMTIRTMLHDSHGFLWAGTNTNMIYRADLNSYNSADPGKLTFEKIKGSVTKKDTLIFSQCFSIMEDADKNILIATESGFYEFDYGTKKFKRYVQRTGDSTSLSDNNVRALCIDNKQRLWLGTVSGGLNLFDKTSQTFTSYTMENGLPDNAVYSILEDNKGFLWLGTNKGLCRFNPENKSCRNFSLKDGIQNYDYNTNAAYKTSSGDLAFGGRTGFNFFNPDSIEISSDPPVVVITRFNVFDKEIPFDTNEITLKSNENSVSFQFAALSFFRNKENQYAYMLEGFENDWMYCGDRRFTNYANLPPGTYIFHVKASNCYGIWKEAGTALRFFIATPWWKTWWFRIVLAAAVASVILVVFRLRLQQKLKLQAVRDRIARDLHDEIGSNLSSIILFSEVAKQELNNSETALSPLLKKISDYTQTSQEAINDIVWMINSRNDRFENIIIRMRSFAAEMFEAKQINFHLNFDDKLSELKMGMNERKNFYLIYKEAINNIVKYAECKNVSVDLTHKHSVLFLHIKDDGKGFDLQARSKGNGLTNMKKRAEFLHGELRLFSGYGKGTAIELKFTI